MLQYSYHQDHLSVECSGHQRWHCQKAAVSYQELQVNIYRVYFRMIEEARIECIKFMNYFSSLHELVYKIITQITALNKSEERKLSSCFGTYSHAI